jgi:hypothetical protein
MDWYPLLIGLLAGAGNGLVAHYGPAVGTGFLGNHKFMLYRGTLVALGAYGELTDHFSPDLRYGLMVAGTTLISQEIVGSFSEGIKAFGDVAISPSPFQADLASADAVALGSLANVRTQEQREQNLGRALHPAGEAG